MGWGKSRLRRAFILAKAASNKGPIVDWIGVAPFLYCSSVPRANRYVVPGFCYHITHRCHDQAFPLRFSRDRDDYRNRLRETLRGGRCRSSAIHHHLEPCPPFYRRVTIPRGGEPTDAVGPCQESRCLPLRRSFWERIHRRRDHLRTEDRGCDSEAIMKLPMPSIFHASTPLRASVETMFEFHSNPRTNTASSDEGPPNAPCMIR